MKLKLALSLAVVAATAFSIGTKVNSQPPDAEPRKASIGLVGYPIFFVDKARPGSPAEKAGLKRGDLVRSINKRTIESPEDLKASMENVKPGQSVEVEYMRFKAEDEKYYVYKVTVEAVERQ